MSAGALYDASVSVDNDFDLSSSELDDVAAPYGISFGDTVRIRSTPAMECLGYAGLTGTVFGQTMPSYSGVSSIVGAGEVDYAINVFFEERDEDVWFAPELVEFMDHAPGTELEIGGLKMIRDEQGEWHEVSRPGLVRRLLNRLR